MGKTELTPRKKAVLSAVVKAYIETGEPIGSKILMGLMENAPSSATLRNEMNELCALGFLTQPHTSAGRIPTSNGYRVYVDALMQPQILGDTAKSFIDSKLLSVTGASQDIPRAVAEQLSELTGYPAICSYIVGEDVTLRQIELLPVGRRSAVLLLVTSDGRTLSRVCHIKAELTSYLIESFKDFAKIKLRHKSLSEFVPALLQNVAMTGGCPFELLSILTELFSMASSASQSKVFIINASKLYNFCDEQSAARIISLAQKCDPLLSVLEKAKEKTDVIFGNDIPFGEFSGKAIVTSKYSLSGRDCGRIGIIAPDRILYDRVIPNIEYTAVRLSRIMADAAQDMED